MNKFVESNIITLKKLKRKSITNSTTQANKKRIDDIIKLYTERKISNVATAENLIKGLTSSNKKVYDKAFQKYKDNIKKFKEAKPLKERMQEARTRNANKEKTYFISFQLYIYYKGNLKESNIKQKPSFIHQGVYYFIKSFQLQTATVDLPNTFIASGNIRIDVRDTLKKENINRRIFRWINVEDFEDGRKENPEFKNVIEVLKKDPEHEGYLNFILTHYDSLGCVKLQSVEVLEKNGKKYNIMDENLTDISYTSIYNRYVHTPIKMEATTIKNAIVKGNHITNACWENALCEFYGDTLMSERTRKRLTVDSIMEITGRKDFYENGVSLNDMDKVFKQYNIPARIFSFFNKLIYQYTPPRQNWHIKPFDAMVKNNHIYVLNHDLKSIQQKQDVHRIPTVQATTDYYINDKDTPAEFKMIENIDDILKLHNKDEKEMHLVCRKNNLNEIFFDLMKQGYEPRIKFQAGCISDIRLKFDKTIYNIKTQNLRTDVLDGCIAVNTENTFNNMNKAMFQFHKGLINPTHKSFYNDIDVKILQEAKTVVATGLCGKITSNERKKLVELDRSKAFTSALLEINEIPVFTQFDVWTKYDRKIHDISKMNKLTLYYVRNWYKEENQILFNKDYCLIFGIFLQLLDLDKISILYFKEPSKTYKVNFSILVNELWKEKISDDEDEDKMIKKTIANVNIGLLEKLGSTDIKSIPFKTLKEALHNQEQFGGRLYKFEKETVESMEVEDIDEEGNITYTTTSDTKTQGDTEASVYILNLKDKAQLKNGFVYIKELLLQYHNFRMYSDYKALTKTSYPKTRDLIEECKERGIRLSMEVLHQMQNERIGVKIYSVKNDAFTICKDDLEKAKARIEFNEKIGSWRVSKNSSDLILPSNDYEIVKNEKIEIPTYSNNTIDIKDEYDTNSIIEEIKTHNPLMIRGEVPGTGKSYICQKMVEHKYKVLFCCPTNRLLQEFEGDAITINKFFGINFGDVKLEKFDFSGYDVIVFDEIYFSDAGTYWRIKRFVEENKNKVIIIGTGDTKQLKSVQELTNTQDYEKYVDKIVDNIFEHNIMLKECKRLHTQEDKDKLMNIKKDIFVNKISTKKLIEKYFRYTNDIASSKFNIAFLNNTCRNVSNEIRKLENRTEEYECGETLICREYTKIKGRVFNVNFKYDIVKKENDILLLKNVKTKQIQPLHIDKVRKNFIFAWCSTCHSAQGCSVNEEITIFDYNHFLVRNYPEWVWTALSRARDLNKVKFFKYNNDKDDEFNKQNIISYFERKIEAYKSQDRAGKRHIPKNGYVNAEWFLDNIKNQCNFCGCGFHLDIKNGNILSNLSCQRKDNSLTHTLDNVIPYCVRCNCSCK